MSTIDMKHYKSVQWNFVLNIPRHWHPMPPVSTNSPNQAMRFASKEDGTHILVIFREIHDPKLALREVSDEIQQVLLSHGFGSFVPGETTIGSRAPLTLDFDKPKDGGTWSCQHYLVADGTLKHILGMTRDTKGRIDKLSTGLRAAPLDLRRTATWLQKV